MSESHHRSDKKSVRRAALHYVANRLSQCGMTVERPDRGDSSFDLLVKSDAKTRRASIKVRSLSKVSAVGLGLDFDHMAADFLVVCCNLALNTPECFVLSRDEVHALANRNEKDGRVSYWLEIRDYRTGSFRDRWDRISAPRDPEN